MKDLRIASKTHRTVSVLWDKVLEDAVYVLEIQQSKKVYNIRLEDFSTTKKSKTQEKTNYDIYQDELTRMISGAYYCKYSYLGEHCTPD